jgi:hypothetical protein
LGTDAQPEPKSMVVADPEDGMAEAIDELDEGIADDDALADEPEADVPFEPLLQAAVPTTRPKAGIATARSLRFMIALFSRFFRSVLSSLGASRDDPVRAAVR